VSILGFDDISLNSWTICLIFVAFQRQLVGEGDKKVVVTICDWYGPWFLYNAVMTDYDWFFVVFFRFWSGYLTISFYRRLVRSPVHPKKAKKPDRTGPQSTNRDQHHGRQNHQAELCAHRQWPCQQWQEVVVGGSGQCL
jgi:hypothetical protein